MQINRFSKVLIISLMFFINSYGQRAVSGWWYNQAAGFSWNPLGVILDGKLIRRSALYPEKEGILWESCKIDFALHEEWTPSDNLFSFECSILPIAFLELNLKAGSFIQYNELGYGSFRPDSPDDPYGASTRKKIGYHDAFGYWLSVNPVLKLKIENVIMLNNFSVNRIAVDGEGYYHEVRSHLIHKVTDTDIINDLFLFYKFNSSVMSGVRYRFINVFGTDAKSHLLCLAALITPDTPFLKNTWLFVSLGGYPVEPLFKAREYVGILAGKDFVLGKRNSGNGKMR
ncbi:MAG TPA: hypothetical protein VHO70_00430 [Chitinispirillaceae bacterium]|nr:hypothetical protein [Chitinispirillaceae bacterium]